jgi:hypothetical protein
MNQSHAALSFVMTPGMTKDEIQTQMYDRIANLPSEHAQQTTEAVLPPRYVRSMKNAL